MIRALLTRGRSSTATSKCEAHSRHSPAHLTAEFHHVVPVAWQQFWQPPKPYPFPGRDRDGRGALWDARGMVLCPTGHRNTHVWIVRLMSAKAGENVNEAVNLTVKAHGRKAASGPEFDAALQALVRYKAAGGSLAALVDAGLLGYA